MWGKHIENQFSLFRTENAGFTTQVFRRPMSVSACFGQTIARHGPAQPCATTGYFAQQTVGKSANTPDLTLFVRKKIPTFGTPYKYIPLNS